ncbi:hypothetical protein BDR26DRAFT_831899 [Obelidium mucronatum]|nr:hypothetical protein BDR26DRAFT_831899 [Obelidium mucronatum]
MLLQLQKLFTPPQKIAYAGMVELLLAGSRFEPRWRQHTSRHLFAFLDVSAEEQAMLANLADPQAQLVPGDLVHGLCGVEVDVDQGEVDDEDSVATLAGKDCIKETIIAHLLILLVSGNNAVYDARARALLLQVAGVLKLTLLDVVRVESEVRDSLGLKTSLLSDGSAKEEVDRRNRTDSVKRVAYVTLATIAGGVLIGATAGLAGPAVAGAFTSAHAIHCGGTAAVGLGSTGVALFATGGAVTAGGMSGFKIMKKTRGISEFEFISSDSQKSIESDFEAVSLTEATTQKPCHKTNTITLHSPISPTSPLPAKSSPSPVDLESNTQPTTANLKKPMNVIISVPGFLGSTNSSQTDALSPFEPLSPYGDSFTLLYESETLQTLNAAITLTTYYTHLKKQTIQKSASSFSNGRQKTLVESMAGPLWDHRISYLIDKPWAIALEKAKACGYLLADAIEMRIQGGRPVTLVGFSLGAKVVYHALLELSRRGGGGGGGTGNSNGKSSDGGKTTASVQSYVDSVYLIGCPAVVEVADWKQIAQVVTGKIVNAYSTQDAVLQLIYRRELYAAAAAGGGGGVSNCQVAGLGPVAGLDNIVENIFLDSIIQDHVDYYSRMDSVLELCGFALVDGGQQRSEKKESESARVRFETDLEDAQERFKDEWNRDVDLVPKQEAYDQSNGVIGGNKGLFSWLSKSSETLKSRRN